MNFLKAQLPRNPSHTYLIDMLRLMLILKSMDSTVLSLMLVGFFFKVGRKFLFL